MTRTYTRRTPEQAIADLEAKIEAVKARQAAKQARTSPEGAQFIKAARALQRATREAQVQGDDQMHQALEAALADLSMCCQRIVGVLKN